MTLQVFDETKDIDSGPRWAKTMALIAVVVAYVGMAGALMAAVLEKSSREGFAIMICGFAVLSGAAWHAGLKARAKNGLILCFIGLTILSFQTNVFNG